MTAALHASAAAPHAQLYNGKEIRLCQLGT